MTKPAKSGYLPSLDGWRAISIVAVMFNHDFAYRVGSHTLGPLQDFGGTFVLLFFAISGFLICTRILEEEHLLGRLNIRGFYIRRLFRIQPAAIFYLLAVALIMLIGWVPQAWKYWFGSLFLYRNYQINALSANAEAAGYLTGHFWTLAVEEHFYFLLSAFLYFVRTRRQLWIALLVLSAFVWPHVSHHLFTETNRTSEDRHTGMQLQYLILPALLAVLLRRENILTWAKRWLLPGPTIWISTVFISLVTMLRISLDPAIFVAHPYLDNLIFPWWDALPRVWPFWIVATVVHPSSMTTRFLELSWMKWVGRLSYSLYLWHVLFFRGRWPISVPQTHSPLILLSHAPWNFICSFACAAMSFYFVEKPLMRLGHRLAPPATPGRQDMQNEPSVEEAIEEASAAPIRTS